MRARALMLHATHSDALPPTRGPRFSCSRSTAVMARTRNKLLLLGTWPVLGQVRMFALHVEARSVIDLP